MNITSQLSEMSSVPHSNVFLAYFYSTYAAPDWSCSFEISTKDLKLKISRSGATPEEAVRACHAEWQALYSHGVDAARPSLLMAPQQPVEVLPIDNQIPF